MDPSKSLSDAFPTIRTKRFNQIVDENSRSLALEGDFRSASRGRVMSGVKPNQSEADPESNIYGARFSEHIYWQSKAASKKSRQTTQNIIG